jgi:hypothetical protein
MEGFEESSVHWSIGQWATFEQYLEGGSRGIEEPVTHRGDGGERLLH